ncbi:MAG: hypothetical protein E7046_04705 [Lentisphaerae bacterium]|nr:hypothetical protein [Lentisphaerota bacterium]
MKTNRIILSLVACCSLLMTESAIAGAVADLNAKGFDWAVFDETTGFAVHTMEDPWAAYSGGIWAGNWSTGKAPESGTNYYSNGKLLYAPKMNSGLHPDFAGDLLVLDSKFRMLQASRHATFNDFVGMGGGRVLVGSTGEGLMTTGEMHFRTTQESPFFISQNSNFGSKTSFSIVSEGGLSSTPETVVSLMEEPDYVGSNKWWHFTVSVSAPDASGFLGKISIPDACLNLTAVEFGGEIEMTNRWVDVSHHPTEGYAITNTPGVFCCKSDSVKIKAVTLHRGTRLDLTFGQWVVGDFKVDGAEIAVNVSQGRNDGGFLTVTNSVSIKEKVRIVNAASAWESIEGVPESIAILRFGREVDMTDISLDDFVLMSTPNNNSALGIYPVQRLVLIRCEDGSSELRLTRNEIVKNVYVPANGERSWRYDTDGAAKFWSDGKREHSGVDYYLHFNGRSPQYWFEKDAVFPAENFLFNNGEMFLKADCVYFTNLIIATAKASLAAKTTKGIDALAGRLGVYSEPDEAVILNAAENMTLDIRSEIYGTGNISFKGVGDKKLSGHNAGFSGKIGFVAGAACRLHFGYGDSLGGAMKTFTYDAVTLTNGTALVPMRDVTIDEPTRGLFINEAGIVDVPARTTMEVKSIVTYGGVLEKKGAGVLALARQPRFVDGREETDPLEGMNLLAVTEGSVKALSPESLNGLALSFSDGAELRIPHMPDDGDFRARGVLMTRALSSVTVPDSGLIVRFDSSVDIEEEFEQGVATFASEDAAESFAGAITLRPRPTGFSYRKEIVENGGTFTVVASLKKIGFSISIR